METNAFFFQGVSLLLPQGAAYGEIPAAYAADFPVVSETFCVPDEAPFGALSCVIIPPEAPLPPRWQTIPVRQTLAALLETSAAARLLRAFHIFQWRQESRFCGSCGGKNTDTDTVARRCVVCGRMEFPRIAPAVITLITNHEDQILLAHNKKFTPGMYSLIAGFAEAGESLEAAVVRETREETDIAISDIRYQISQPWPFPHSLMAGFTARYSGGTIKPDGVEIEDAGWFGRNSLPQLPGHGSVARHLIERWLSGDLF